MLPKLRGLTSVTHLPTPHTGNSESPAIRETKSENLALNCDWHRGCSWAETGMMEPLSHPKWHLSGRFRKARVTAPRDRQMDSLELISHRSDQRWCLLTHWSFVGRACRTSLKRRPLLCKCWEINISRTAKSTDRVGENEESWSYHTDSLTNWLALSYCCCHEKGQEDRFTFILNTS